MTQPKQPASFHEMLIQMAIHDLRAPLSSILTGIELTLQPDMSAEDTRRVLKLCLDSGGKLIRQMESLLDIAHIETGQMPIHAQTQPLQPIIADAVMLLTNLIEEMHLQVEIHAPSDLPPVFADDHLTRRVLVNLIDNAIHHTPTGTRIHIDAAHESTTRQVRVRICDDGSGIPVEQRESIFESYRRPSAQRRARRGFGWGLAFCKLAIEAQGGQIAVEDADGDLRGACFMVSLPTG
ncbi:MAG: ATP-binding protein [Chloroflexota bacterium]|nr:ATP-binding protein [Chloroflexota bacterium]